MKEDPRDYIVPIRMNYEEKSKIQKRANEVQKNLSTFMRESALGCEIKQKPDMNFYESLKPIGKFLRTLTELERLLYHKGFIDERILNNEITEWRKFRIEIKEKFL